MADVNEIKTRVNIVDIIGRHVDLRHAGKNYMGVCPFHKDTDPSFSVSEDKQLYYCFGCGAGGDVIKFIMDYYGFDFAQTMETLADEAGVDYEYNFDAKLRYVNLRNTLKVAHQYYMDSMPTGAQAYLDARGIERSIQEELQIGYAPNNGGLIDVLRKEGLSIDDGISAGVLSENGKTHSRFADRIIFPIKDYAGRLISFAGRLLPDCRRGFTRPKYMNGPKTALYNKSNVLYGYHWARATARYSKSVYVVEGYLDHAILYQEGLKNVVSTCGTSMTQYQARNILKLSDSPMLCFDSDKSGKVAAIKAGESILAEGGLPVFALFGDNRDPHDVVKEFGIQKFLSITDNPIDILELGMEILGGWGNVVGTHRERGTLQRMTSLIEKTQDPISKAILMKRLSRMTGYNVEAFRRPNKPAHVQPSELHVELTRFDKTAVWLLLTHEKPGKILDILKVEDLESDHGQKIIKQIMDQFEEDGVISASALSATDANAVSQIAMRRHKPDDNDVDAFKNTIYLHRLEGEREGIIKQLENSSNKEDLLKQLFNCTDSIRKLRKQSSEGEIK